MTATLYVVATPIGHLDDITYRAVKILREVSVIAAEDTRYSKRLLNYWQIFSKHLVSVHAYNEAQRVVKIKTFLSQGLNVALICNAGTPLISDPGYTLVTHLQDLGFRISPVPGPSAFVAALSVAGMPTDHFHFEGFLPAREKARSKRLEALRQTPETMVFYEAPHRVLKSLETMVKVFGETRQAAIARELTKQFETVCRDTLKNLLDKMVADPRQQQGEIVIIVSGAAIQAGKSQEEIYRIMEILIQKLPLKEAIQMGSRITGEQRNKLYRIGLAIKKGQV